MILSRVVRRLISASEEEASQIAADPKAKRVESAVGDIVRQLPESSRWALYATLKAGVLGADPVAGDVTRVVRTHLRNRRRHACRLFMSLWEPLLLRHVGPRHRSLGGVFVVSDLARWWEVMARRRDLLGREAKQVGAFLDEQMADGADIETVMTRGDVLQTREFLRLMALERLTELTPKAKERLFAELNDNRAAELPRIGEADLRRLVWALQAHELLSETTSALIARLPRFDVPSWRKDYAELLAGAYKALATDLTGEGLPTQLAIWPLLAVMIRKNQYATLRLAAARIPEPDVLLLREGLRILAEVEAERIGSFVRSWDGLNTLDQWYKYEVDEGVSLMEELMSDLAEEPARREVVARIAEATAHGLGEATGTHLDAMIRLAEADVTPDGWDVLDWGTGMVQRIGAISDQVPPGPGQRARPRPLAAFKDKALGHIQRAFGRSTAPELPVETAVARMAQFARASEVVDGRATQWLPPTNMRLVQVCTAVLSGGVETNVPMQRLALRMAKKAKHEVDQTPAWRDERMVQLASLLPKPVGPKK